MVLLFDGNSEYVAQEWGKIGFFEKKSDPVKIILVWIPRSEKHRTVNSYTLKEKYFLYTSSVIGRNVSNYCSFC